MRENTTLACDWLDRTQASFATNSSLAQASCHVRVLSRREQDEATYSCFDFEGRAQGCHAFVKKKVAELQFLTGCATGSLADWGWCGRWPWSSLWGRGGSDHDDAGCTTLYATLQWAFLVCREHCISVFALMSSAVVLNRSYNNLAKVLKGVKHTTTELVERQNGVHARKYIQRVSLQLNILEEKEVVKGGEDSRLYLRTLWEKELQDIIPDQVGGSPHSRVKLPRFPD